MADLVESIADEYNNPEEDEYNTPEEEELLQLILETQQPVEADVQEYKPLVPPKEGSEALTAEEAAEEALDKFDFTEALRLKAFDVSRNVVQSIYEIKGQSEKFGAKHITGGDKVPVMQDSWEDGKRVPRSITKDTYKTYMDKDISAADKIVHDLEKIKGPIYTDQIEYGKILPMPASFEKEIGQYLKEAYPNANEDELDYKRGVLYTAFGRKKQLRKLERSDYWIDKGERIFPQEEKLYNLFKELEEITEPDKFDVINLKKSWDVSGFNAKLSKMLTFTALTNPQKAADLVPLFAQLKQEAEDSKPNQGRLANTVANVAGMLNPMIKSGLKGIAGNMIFPGLGTIVSTSDWASMATGDMFFEMVQAGVDPELAMKVALPFGILHGAVEALQIGKLTSVGKKAFKNGLFKNFMKNMSKINVDKFKDFGVEQLEEMIQGAIEEFALESGKRFEGISQGDWVDFLSKGVKGFVKAGVETAPEIALLTLLTGGIGSVAGKLSLNQKGLMNTLQSEEMTIDQKKTYVDRYLAKNPDTPEEAKRYLEMYFWAQEEPIETQAEYIDEGVTDEEQFIEEQVGDLKPELQPEGDVGSIVPSGAVEPGIADTGERGVTAEDVEGDVEPTISVDEGIEGAIEPTPVESELEPVTRIEEDVQEDIPVGADRVVSEPTGRDVSVGEELEPEVSPEVKDEVEKKVEKAPEVVEEPIDEIDAIISDIEAEIQEPTEKEPEDELDKVIEGIVTEVDSKLLEKTEEKISEEAEVKDIEVPEITEEKKAEIDLTPTKAQIEAGNNKKGHERYEGFDITIENYDGQTRTSKDPENPWEIKMQDHYGYIRGSVGADKDHVDSFINPKYRTGLPVFIVNQTNKDGSFDEHKVMMGYPDFETARKAYLRNYEKGWNRFRSIAEMEMPDFKQWVFDKKKTKSPATSEKLHEEDKDAKRPRKEPEKPSVTGVQPGEVEKEKRRDKEPGDKQVRVRKPSDEKVPSKKEKLKQSEKEVKEEKEDKTDRFPLGTTKEDLDKKVITKSDIEKTLESKPVSEIVVDEAVPEKEEVETKAVDETKEVKRKAPEKIEVVKNTFGNYDLTGKPPIKLTQGQRKKINAQVYDILNKINSGEIKEITEEHRNILSQYTGEGGIGKETLFSKMQHYTDYPTISRIYEVLDKAGVKYENVLEPSAGAGNFVGMRSGKNWTTVELDSTNNQVVNILYPQAKNYHTGFESFKGKGFDLIVSNVPFIRRDKTSLSIIYPEIKSLHDMFFVHALDKLKSNGVLAFITSTSTSDKTDPTARQMMMDRGDILGIFRLPQGHFTKTAHTDVSADLIFIQKRPDGVASRQPQINEDFISTKDYEGIRINKLLSQNKTFLGDKLERGVDKLYGREQFVLTGETHLEKIDIDYKKYKTKKDDKTGLPDEVKDDKFPNNLDEIDSWTKENPDYMILKDYLRVYNEAGESRTITFKDPNFNKNVIAKNGEVFLFNKNIELSDVEGTFKVYKKIDNEVVVDKINDLLKISRLVEKYQKTFETEEDSSLSTQALELSEKYEKEFGNPYADQELKSVLTDRSVKTKRPYPFYWKLLSPFNPDFSTRDVFFKNVRPKGKGILPISKDSTLDKRALGNENNKGIIIFDGNQRFITTSEIPSLLELGYGIYSENGVIKLQNPVLYYSGMIRTKIKQLEDEMSQGTPSSKKYESQYSKQIKDLNNLTLDGIDLETAKISGNEEWLIKILNEENIEWYVKPGLKDGRIYYTIDTNIYSSLLRKTDIPAEDRATEKEMDKVMNFRNPTGKKKTYESAFEYEKRLEDTQNRIEVTQAAINRYIIKTSGQIVQDKISDTYNLNFRNYVSPDYNKAKYIIASDLNKANAGLDKHGKKLRKNQEEWLAQAFVEGSGLNAHDVGGGKTISGIVAAKMLKDHGLALKPIIVVPAKVINGWNSQIKEIYPEAKIINLGNLSADVREQKLQELKNTIDVDFTLITIEGFTNIRLGEVQERKSIEMFLEEYTSSLSDAALSKQQRMKILQRREDIITYFLNKPRNPELTFEELGIDAILSDESHKFKNLPVNEKLKEFKLATGFNVKPSGAVESVGAFEFKFKTDYVLENNNNNNIFLFTATPASNKVMEIYTMTKYLKQNLYKEYGINNDLDFANKFIDTGSVYNPLRKKTESALIGIKNYYEFRDLLKRFIDIKSMEDMHHIEIPTMEDIEHFVDISPEMMIVMNDLKRRQEELSNSDNEDNLMSVMTNGRAASVDPALYHNKKFGDHDSYVTDVSKDINTSKITRLVNEVTKNFKKEKGTQLIFLDFYGQQLDENLYNVIKKRLLNRGFKKAEIGIVSGKELTTPEGNEKAYSGNKKDQRKFEIEQEFNRGEFKVLIGSTVSMGEGMNLQTNSTDVYHLDIPYKPSDIIQRVGRIRRPGNLNPFIRNHFFVTPGTFDFLSMDILMKKQGWVNAIYKLKGDTDYVPASEGSIGKAASREQIAIALETDPIEKEKMIIKLDYDSDINTFNELIQSRQENRRVAESYGKTIQDYSRRISESEDKINKKESSITSLKDESAEINSKAKKSKRDETRLNTIKKDVEKARTVVNNQKQQIDYLNRKKTDSLKKLGKTREELSNQDVLVQEIQAKIEFTEKRYIKEEDDQITIEIPENDIEDITKKHEHKTKADDLEEVYLDTEEARGNKKIIVEKSDIQDVYARLNYIMPQKTLKNLKVLEGETYIENGFTKKLGDKNGVIIYNRNSDSLTIVMKPGLDPQQKADVVFHELIGHVGLTNVMDIYPEIYSQAQILFDKEVDLKNLIKEAYEMELDEVKSMGGQSAYDKLLFEEWIAHSLEKHMAKKEPGVFKKIWDLFKRILYKLGIAKPGDVESMMDYMVSKISTIPPHQVRNDINQYRDVMASKTLGKKEIQKIIAPLKSREQKKIIKVVDENLELKEKYKNTKTDFLRKLKDIDINWADYKKAAWSYFKAYNTKDGKGRALLGRNDLLELKAFMTTAPTIKTETSLQKKKELLREKIDDIVHKKRKSNAQKGIRKALNSMPEKLKTEYNIRKKELFKFLDKNMTVTDDYFTFTKLDRSLKSEVYYLEKVQKDAELLANEIIQDEADFLNNLRQDVNRDIEQLTSNLNSNRKTVPNKTIGSEPTKFDMNTPIKDFFSLRSMKSATIAEWIENKDQFDNSNVLAKHIRALTNDSLNKRLKVIYDIRDKMFEKFSEKEINEISSVAVASEKEKHESITLDSGKEISISRAHLISFFNHGLNQEENADIIKKYGFVYNTRMFSLDKVVTEQEVDGFITEGDLTGAELDELFSGQHLTNVEKDFGLFVFEKLNNELKDYLNETSMAVRNVPIAMVDDYFPRFRVDTIKDHLERGTNLHEGIGNIIRKSLEDEGSLQPRTGGTSPVMISDIFTTFYTSLSVAASYHGYAQELRSIKQILDDRNVNQTARDTGWAKEMGSIKRFVRQIEQRGDRDPIEGQLKRFISNSVVIALGNNPIVMGRQTGSYILAGTEIELKYLLKGLGLGINTKAAQENVRLLVKHSPMIRARITESLINPELSSIANEREVSHFYGSKKSWKELSTAGIGKTDAAVINRIGYAVRRKIESTTNLTGVEKWDAISRETERVMSLTQPMYDIGHRSEIGRSKSALVRLTFMFTTALNAVYDQMARAILRYKRTGNGKELSRNFALAYLSSAPMMLLWDLVRDKLVGKEPPPEEWVERAIVKSLSPIYGAGYVSALIFDLISAFGSGNMRFENLTRASGSVLGIILRKLMVTFREGHDFFGQKGYAAGDWDSVMVAMTSLMDILGYFGMLTSSYSNLYKYGKSFASAPSRIVEFTTGKKDYRVKKIAREHGIFKNVKDRIPIKGQKFKINHKYLKEYEERVMDYWENSIDGVEFRKDNKKWNKAYLKDRFRKCSVWAFWDMNEKYNDASVMYKDTKE